MESKSSERAAKSFYCFPIFPFADPLVGGDFTSSSKASAPFFSSPFTPPKVPNNIQLLSSSSIVASPYQPKEFSRKNIFRETETSSSCCLVQSRRHLRIFYIFKLLLGAEEHLSCSPPRRVGEVKRRKAETGCRGLPPAARWLFHVLFKNF